jgi:diguanylate cyclase (GGDEF)-like protein
MKSPIVLVKRLHLGLHKHAKRYRRGDIAFQNLTVCDFVRLGNMLLFNSPWQDWSKLEFFGTGQVLLQLRIARMRTSILPSGFHRLEEVERGQAIFRLWGGSGFLYTVLLMYVFGKRPTIEIALWCAVAYSVMGVSWIYFISLVSVAAESRRKLIIFLDLIIWSIGLCLAGEIYALTLWLPLTVSMGNGLRYSPKHGFISATVSGVCVAIALELSPYWRNMPLVSVGIFLTVTVMPIYAFLLTKKISKNKYLMEQRAATLEAAIRCDALTGVLNRTGFTIDFERTFAEAQLPGRRAALLVIDLDGFKAVNDSAGHAAGDDVLRRVAAAMRSCLRLSDSIGRLGGDEFAVVLTSLQSSDDARWIADKIVLAVAALAVPGHDGLSVGASVGMCLLPSAEIRTIEEALAVADALMYDSKRSGKGMVTGTPIGTEVAAQST